MLLSILDNLSRHHEEGRNSLLSQVIGLFEFKLNNFKAVNIIVMVNSVDAEKLQGKVRYKFDLKGSSLSRNSLSKR